MQNKDESGRVELSVIPDTRVDLHLRREFPANIWPGREVSQWWRFSFPIRCLDEVKALAEECEKMTERDALELVRRKRREIQWPSEFSR